MNQEKVAHRSMPWLGSLVTHLAVFLAFALLFVPPLPGPAGPIVLEASVSESYEAEAEELLELDSIAIEDLVPEPSFLETMTEVPIEVPPTLPVAEEPAPSPSEQEGLAEGTAEGTAEGSEDGESESEEIARRVASAGGEGGVLQFSLAWEGTHDLDIHIVTPFKERISFKKKEATRSGGVLDVDMNAREREVVFNAVENVRFGGSPPIGKYRVVVHLYKNRGQGREKIPFRLRVKRGEDVLVRRGFVSWRTRIWEKTFGYRGNPERRTSMFNLDEPLIELAPQDWIDARSTMAGTFICGTTGAGKTSGSGQSLLKAMMARGYGGVVHCAKPGDRAEVEQWAKEVGRKDSVIVFDLHGKHRFNFIDHEAKSGAAHGAFSSLTIVEVLKSLAKNVGRNESEGGGGDDGTFWLEQFGRLVKKASNLMMSATGGVSIEGIRDIVRSAPNSVDELDDEQWEANSLCAQMIEETYARIECLDHRIANDFLESGQFFYKDYPNLAEKTRSVIDAKMNAVLELFLEGPLREVLCSTTTICPEVALNGGIIILDAPVRQYKELGQAFQLVFKHAFQRAAERSKDRAKPDAIPAFLWADEAQLFLTEHDQNFLTTARTSKVATVFLTQNISNFYAALGGESKKATVDSLLGNLATKVFHAQSDNVTNQWAADLIGKEWQYRLSTSQGESTLPGQPVFMGKSANESTSLNEQLEYTVLPSEFTTLRTGGPANDFKVDAIVHQAGRKWEHSGKSALYATFDQRI